MSPESDNKETVRAYWAALDDREPDVARKFLHEDVERHHPPDETFHGIDRFIEIEFDFADRFPGSYDIDFLVAEGDLVTLKYDAIRRHDDDQIKGVSPTEEEFRTSGIEVFRVDGGEIVESWHMANLEGLFKSLGFSRQLSDLRIQRQLLEVLLRVLRHNIRNDINAINGMAEMIASGDVGAADYANRIQVKASSLQATAEKVRDVEQAVTLQDRSEPTDLTQVIGTVLAEHRQQYPQTELDVAIPGEEFTIMSNRTVLTMALEEAIENAVTHADSSEPTVTVTLSEADADEYAAAITVTDDGPGIPDHELRPIERGSEDPLEHGSGIGLWAIKWGIEQLNGTVEFEENEPRGTAVRLRLPNLE